MANVREFSPEVARKLGHYVYLYVDPITNDIFYVGKGRGNRAFSHLADTSESEKAERIAEIRRAGREPIVEILVHGLKTQEEAYRVEAAAIDLLGKGQLTNAVRGWRSGTYGRMSAEQIEAQYGADEVEVTHPAILIKINQLFRYGMTPLELYEATRGHWVVGENREKAELALAVFEGVVQEVYRVESWFPAGSTFFQREGMALGTKRWEFVGRIAEDEVRDAYRMKSVRHYWGPGAQNPIRYVNID